jgi:hypothetical protein
MSKGTIAALYGEHGQVIYEGKAYDFNTRVVKGGIRNHQEIEFEFDETNFNIKVIFGNGAKKPEPTPKKKQKENTTSKLVDNRDLLTEEK